MRRRAAVARWGVALALAAGLLAEGAWARVGGGSSYSGSRSSGSRSSSFSSSGSRSSSSSHSSSWSSSSSSSSSGSADLDPGSCFTLVLVVVVLLSLRYGTNFFSASTSGGKSEYVSLTPAEAPAPVRRSPPESPAARMRRFDAAFSEPLFLEWASLVYTRAHEALGQGQLEVMRPYFTPGALTAFTQRQQGPVKDVRGVVIGAVKLTQLRDLGLNAQLEVSFQSNYTVVAPDGREQAFYAHETWRFQRAKAVASRTPETVQRAGCPSCGSPVERSSLDKCAHCGAAYTPGTLDWTVAVITMQELEKRPPLLTADVEEQGTDLPTVHTAGLRDQLAALRQDDPDFTPEQFEATARRIFLGLQEAWTKGQWEAIRPNETDTVFQSHRFWLEEYRRQGLRNVLEGARVDRLEVVKVERDQYFEAITCRIWAAMRDSTVKVATGQVVAGNPRRLRAFTEYWTFIRRRGLKTRPPSQDARPSVGCPNCGAPLSVNQAGICAHCDAKVTRGDFSWVLSRIDQDEEYTG